MRWPAFTDAIICDAISIGSALSTLPICVQKLGTWHQTFPLVVSSIVSDSASCLLPRVPAHHRMRRSRLLCPMVGGDRPRTTSIPRRLLPTRRTMGAPVSFIIPSASRHSTCTGDAFLFSQTSAILSPSCSTSFIPRSTRWRSFKTSFLTSAK